MRILHSESSKGWGGQENRTLNELIGMRNLGHELAVVCQPGARLVERAREIGIPVYEVPMRGAADFPAILKLRHLMREGGFDVVNTHSGRDTQLAGMAARSLGGRRPRVVRTRHLALPITSRFTYSILPDHVVTVSRFVGEYLASAGVPREKITAVPTGIDFSRYQAAPEGGTLRTELNMPAEAVLIGTVAILRFKKGHGELLEAIPSVLERHPEAHFVFAGDGPMQADIQKRIAEAGLEGRVHLLGLRRDVVNVLQSLDLFVLPTHQEALGTAFIEAAAMGLPAIGTRVDGVPEVVAEGKTGLLVPAGDSASLARAIVSLLDDPDWRRAMGIAARRWVEEQFSREAMASGMDALYRRLLESR